MKIRSREKIVARERAHAAFDLLWRAGGVSRPRAYAMLRERTGKLPAEAHIGKMSFEECEALELWVATLFKPKLERLEGAENPKGEVEPPKNLEPRQVLHLATIELAKVRQAEKTERMRLSHEQSKERDLLFSALDLIFATHSGTRSRVDAAEWIAALPDFARRMLESRKR